MNPKIMSGIIQGFYWDKQSIYEGQYFQFSHHKRLQLLQFMSYKHLNTYLYDPKLLRGNNYDRIYHKQLIGNQQQWIKTFKLAIELNINFYWGIALGHSDNWNIKLLIQGMNYLLQLGVNGFIILFDDSPGGSTLQQIVKQIQIVTILKKQFNKFIVAFCPGIYCGTSELLRNQLALLNEKISLDIPFILCGRQVWNRNVVPQDFLIFEQRDIIFWDNWMATDSINRTVTEPPTGRHPLIYKTLVGHLLNAAFPVERIIPIVSAFAEILQKSLSVVNQITGQFDHQMDLFIRLQVPKIMAQDMKIFIQQSKNIN